MNYLVFDVETRVDKVLLAETLYPGQIGQLGERFGAAGDLQWIETAESLYQRFRKEQLERWGNDFAPVPFHVPVAIAIGVVDRSHRLAAVRSLGPGTLEADRERALVEDFWRRVDGGFNGCLITFNGRGFDLPVLELQALRYGISLKKYFGAKYGPRHRYQTETHLDLFEFLSNYGAVRLNGGLDALLRICGLGGKGELRGADVQGLIDAGRLDLVETYCRRDVLNTYRLFLRVQVIRGVLSLSTAEELDAAATADETKEAA